MEVDVVVGADGQSSKTRRLAFPSIEDPIKGLGQYTAYFTIPFEERDGKFAKWYNAPSGRCLFLRLDNVYSENATARTYISIMGDEPRKWGYDKMSIGKQKKMWRELLQGCEWEAERVLDGMDATDDFYMQEIAQVRMDSFVHGRVALLGDAGYCPSPISGMGTTIAIVGGYMLAGELVRCKGD
ncbi:hypothetical protein B0J14DRAFT_581335 [Halenospora varia]|nr:hypothetical protein B0J14DRAFT_581335 [Halenospora varia]